MTEMHHPREVFDLTGHDAAEEAFEATRARGRLHHAWLLTGPEGAGKATFAYRAARRLLGAPADPAYGVLGASPDHPVSRQIIARAHPDLFVLERVGEDGKVRKVIPVDEARGLSEFFSKSPASAPHRVAIIDAVDDLNTNAANAILKTLEEPPPSGVLLMVSHAPGRLLPTIRSRCRRLAFRPLALEAAAAFVRDREDVSEEAALRLAKMAGGAPGRAWALAGANAIAMDDAARALIEDLPGSTRPWLYRWQTGSAAGRAPHSSTCCSTGWPSGSMASPAIGRGRAWAALSAGRRPGKRCSVCPARSKRSISIARTRSLRRWGNCARPPRRPRPAPC